MYISNDIKKYEDNHMETHKTKRERFLKVAESRTNKILSMIKLLGNCANSNNYAYTQKEVKQIFDAIDNELRNTKKKFNASKSVKFSFGDKR